MVNPFKMESKKVKAWPKLQGEENKLLREQLSAFCQETSFTVLVNIYKASNIIKKLAWFVTFLACLGWLSFQCYYLLDRYFSYPYDVTMKVQTVPELDFPSVTVCNMNPVKSSSLNRGPLKSLLKFTKDHFKDDNKLYAEALNFYGGSVQIGKRNSGGDSSAQMSGPGTATNSDSSSATNPGPGSATNTGSGSTSNTGQGSTSNPGPNSTINSGPGPTTNPTPASTTNTGPEQTTRSASGSGSTSNTGQGSTSNPGPNSTTNSGPGPTTNPSPAPTTNTGPEQTTRSASGSTPSSAGPTTRSTTPTTSSTTEDSFGDNSSDQRNTMSTLPWGMGYYTTPEVYYDSLTDYLVQKEFNQWDMLDSRNVTDFYTTVDSEFDAALLYAEMSAKISEESVLKTGHQLKDFMISCKYAGFPCSPHNFTSFHNNKYGNCYTFNHPERMKSAKTRSAGPLFGLSIEFYLEQSEYVPALSQEAGVRVVIHSRNATPFPEDEGVSVAPGYATSMGLEVVEMVRLGPPHSDCANIGTVDDLYQLHTAYNYSKISCMKSCYQKLIIDECKCELAAYFVLNRDAVCNMTNEETAWCVTNIEDTRSKEYNSCNRKCPQACFERKYEKSISAAEWPSNNYKDQLTSRFKTSRSDFMESFSLAGDQLKDFVKLSVYFQEMVYKSIEDTKSYESMNLISDIGGQLGLWLGLSAITIGELFSFILLVIRGLSTKMCSSKTSPVEKVKLDQMS